MTLSRPTAEASVLPPFLSIAWLNTCMYRRIVSCEQEVALENNLMSVAQKHVPK